MHSFDTLDGARWSFAITYGTVKHVLDETGFRLTDLFDPKAAAKVLGDPFEFMRVMYAAVQSQEKQGKSFDDFLRGFDDTVLASATNALLEAIIDFFQEPRRTIARRGLERVKTETERLTGVATRAAEEKLKAMDVAEIISQTLTSSDSSSPASVA